MKIGDTVSIRVDRDRRVVFGRLCVVSLADGLGLVNVGGRKYLRDLKRIKPEAVGLMERARKAGRRRR